MFNKNTLISTLALLLAVSSVDASKAALPKVSEYYSFGENNVVVSILQANLGVSMSVYKNLLMREQTEYRADECYKDLWMLADDAVGSFNVLGRGDIS